MNSRTNLTTSPGGRQRVCGNDYLAQRLDRTCGLLKTKVDSSAFRVRFAGFELFGRRYCRTSWIRSRWDVSGGSCHHDYARLSASLTRSCNGRACKAIVKGDTGGLGACCYPLLIMFWVESSRQYPHVIQ